MTTFSQTKLANTILSATRQSGWDDQTGLAHKRFIYQDGFKSYALYSGAIPPQNLSESEKEIWMDGWESAATQAGA